MLNEFVVLYNPFYGVIGVFGHILISGINFVQEQKEEKETKERPFLYYLSLFFISFTVAMMFSETFTHEILSRLLKTEIFIGAFILGMLTPSYYYILKAFGTRVEKIYKICLESLGK